MAVRVLSSPRHCKGHIKFLGVVKLTEVHCRESVETLFVKEISIHKIHIPPQKKIHLFGCLRKALSFFLLQVISYFKGSVYNGTLLMTPVSASNWYNDDSFADLKDEFILFV